MRAIPAIAIIALVAAIRIAVAGPAQDLADEAVAAAQRKDWETARKKFEQAYALEPRPLTLYNLAAAQEHTKRLVAARESYTRFLVDGDDPRFRQLARQALTRIDKAIPTLTVTLTGASTGVGVAIDGKPATVGAAVPVDPGTRVVTAVRDGATVASSSLTLAEGAHEKIELVVPVPQVRANGDEGKRPQVTPAILPAEQQPRSALRSPWLWGAIAGAVVVGVTVTYWGIARPESDPMRGTLGPGTLPTP